MDEDFPQRQDGHPQLTIRSQEFILSPSAPAAPSLRVNQDDGPRLGYVCVVCMILSVNDKVNFLIPERAQHEF